MKKSISTANVLPVVKNVVANSKTSKVVYAKFNGAPLNVLHFTKDLTGSFGIVFEFQNDIEKQWYIVHIKKKTDLTPNMLAQILVDKGVQVIDKQALYEVFEQAERKAMNKPDGYTYYVNSMSLFAEMLKKEEPIYKRDFNSDIVPTEKIVNIHDKIGWYDLGQDLVFLGENRITEKGVEKSIYTGEVRIKPTGDYNEYVELLKKHVIGNTPLELALCIGASAPLIYWANNEWDEEMECLVISLVGMSSSGKTTAGQLAVSTGGYPAKSRGSQKALYMYGNSTDNALLSMITDNFGYPALIDEFSVVSVSKASRLLYSLAEGSDKSRRKPGVNELQECDSFLTTVITTNESSILDKNALAGLRTRIIELLDIEWTYSAECSEQIKSVVTKNYGHIIPMVAQELLLDVDHIWKEEFELWRDKFKTESKKRNAGRSIMPYVERVSRKLAIIMVSARIINKVTGVNLNCEDIFEFLYEYVIKPMDLTINLGQRVYDIVKEAFTKEKNKYEIREWYQEGSTYGSYEGVLLGLKSPKNINNKVYNRAILITENKLDHILKENGIKSNINTCLREVKKLGLLKTDNPSEIHAYRTQFPLNGEDISGYGFYLQELHWGTANDDDIFEDTTTSCLG